MKIQALSKALLLSLVYHSLQVINDGATRH
jgi:hypothetical protein